MMIQNALSVFKKAYPTKTPTGYWVDGDNIVLNTKSEYGKGYDDVCQFVIFNNGSIMPTNPLRSDVILETPMKKIY